MDCSCTLALSPVHVEPVSPLTQRVGCVNHSSVLLA